jgi:hypothetical protein
MKTGKWSTLTAATALTSIVATAGVTHAATITETASLAPIRTNFTDKPISISKFDPTQGILKSVTVDFTGRVQGSAGFENTDAQPADVTVDLAGNLSLNLPDGTSLLSLSPTSETTTSVDSYDGTTDFAGPSGRTLTGLSATKSGTETFTGSSFLNLFTGTDNLDFLFSAIAKSTINATGNIASYVNTSAGADIIKVTYDYQGPPKSVPEADATVSLGVVVGLGILFSKRRAWKKA